MWVCFFLTALASAQSRELLSPVVPQEAQPPTFRSGVQLVLVSAVVRDRRGRLVAGLTQEDFEVVDGGEARTIRDFWATRDAAISVGLLLDVSGSMGVGSKMDDARSGVNMLLGGLRDDVDESTVFTFDRRLRELLPSSTERRYVEMAKDALSPFGATSLYDAIAEAAQRVADRPTIHRAVVVVSDGVDTRSTLTAPEVSSIASAIDVPVYLLAVVSPLDLPNAPTASPTTAAGVGRLRDLARWTGGGVYFASTPAETRQATARLLRELRHQYVLAFESATEPGWRQIEVRVDGKRVSTRAAYQSIEVR